MSAVIEASRLAKRYGAVEALQGIDLTVQPGEVVALLGPNGAGKTTAVSLMLGLRRPSAGQIRLFGLDPSDRRARSRIGVMLQESGVPGLLTVRELVDLFRTYYPAPLPAARAIALAGLGDRQSMRMARLSGGERQRLYFALALCGDPEALFLDEPTVAMDVDARHAFMAAMHDLAAAGKTILFTTHYLHEAGELARRIVIIHRGRVIADAPPREITARVATKRVAFRPLVPLVPGALDGLPAARVDAAGAHVRLITSEPEAVLRELFHRGVELTDLEVLGADLEEAFLSLTRDAGSAP